MWKFKLGTWDGLRELEKNTYIDLSLSPLKTRVTRTLHSSKGFFPSVVAYVLSNLSLLSEIRSSELIVMHQQQYCGDYEEQ